MRSRPTPEAQQSKKRAVAKDDANHSEQISLDDKGQLTISEAGARRIDRTFLGPDADYETRHGDFTSLNNIRFAQVIGSLPEAKGKDLTPQTANIALDGVAALEPRDGMEVMLCSQLVALHSQGMDFLRRGMLADQTVDGVDRNVNRATKLLRTFATMADCLRTYRGGGHQRVTVEHVTVQSGGQAIVGTVNRHAGGGDARQNRE